MHKIAVVPGDGTGPEVVVEGLKALKAVSEKAGFNYETVEFDFGGDRYLRTNEVLPDSGYADYLIGLFREVARERRPLYGESDFRGQGHIEHRVRRLLMPLSRDGRAVDMIFGGQVASGPGARAPDNEGAGPFHEIVRVLLV
ncbi:MAG: hypothetical protein IIC53_13295 [Proteobacteria bacterium]|nr:hypothetical protein [Pseudomonadota bacterium]